MKIKFPLFLYKIFIFEYWPMWAFYLPILPYWLYLSLKTKSFAYFSVANPGIYLGGFFGESKTEILNLIDKKYLPIHIEIEENVSQKELLDLISINKFIFPVIAKPDIGERGNFVSKIENIEQLMAYHLLTNKNKFIIQEYINFPIELGVLYSRMPNENSGKVSSITFKKFLSVKGNGKNTIVELMEKSVRARFQINRLLLEKNELLFGVPLVNEIIVLEPIGNHCRGTQFVNYNNLISSNINKVFDEISSNIKGFYYGRFDLKVKSIEDFEKGLNIKIMELNGASSEPGHIYDIQFSIFKAYKSILYHWKRLADISVQNIEKGIKPVSFNVILKSYFNFAFSKKAKF